jgi:DNA-binding response OmpR family regulator
MRILLVEDDRDLLEPLQEALNASGHGVDAVENGAIAQGLIAQKNYDLLILDWMLPGVSGLHLCQHYRQSGKSSPVLMLTAKDTTQDKIAGLDAGADDYLVKPVDMLEFLARVRALGRRSPLWQGDILTLADLSLHLNRLMVERVGTIVELSGREFQLMEYFMRHPQQVLTRNQIEETIWTWGEEPESNAITTLVRRLRQRLRDIHADHWIETIYGIGYRLRPLPHQTLNNQQWMNQEHNCDDDSPV